MMTYIDIPHQRRKMADTNTKLKLAEAAKVAGVSTNTINRAKKSGKVSVEIEDGVAHYEPSELARVFPKTFKYERLKSSNDDKTSPSDFDKNINTEKEKVSVKVLETKLAAAEEMLTKEKDERKREIENYEERIDDLKTILKEAQSNETRLIEYNKDKEGQGDKIKQIIEPLREELSNLKTISESDKNKVKDLKKANRFQKLFIAFLVIFGVVVFAMWQLDIIPLNLLQNDPRFNPPKL